MSFILRITKSTLLTLSVISIILSLQGCPAVIFGAAGGTALAIHDRRDSETMLQDQRIESTATNKLYDDPELKTKVHINVTSYNRVVLLSGEVLTHDALNHALDIVKNIPDVRLVHNELQVADLTPFSSRSNDTWITSTVKAQMLNEKDLDATRIKVVTEKGNVFLMGLVTDKEAELAVNVARNVKYVSKVTKLFEIIPEPAVTQTAAETKK